MATKTQKKKFDAEFEAMKIILEEQKREAKMAKVIPETSKRKGTEVIVYLTNGDKKIFYYAEGGMFKGWNEAP